MKRDQLKKLELSDEIIDAVMKLHGEDVEAHKGQLETKQGELTALQGQLDEANKQVAAFKKLDPDAIQKAAADWEQKAKDFEAQAKKAAADADMKVSALQFDHALTTALTEAKAKNPKTVRALLNADNLKMGEDGSIIGLKEQLETITKENGYLFTDETPVPEIVTGGNHSTVTADAFMSSVMKGAGLKAEK
jgi:hypothetical protein